MDVNAHWAIIFLCSCGINKSPLAVANRTDDMPQFIGLRGWFLRSLYRLRRCRGRRWSRAGIVVPQPGANDRNDKNCKKSFHGEASLMLTVSKQPARNIGRSANSERFCCRVRCLSGKVVVAATAVQPRGAALRADPGPFRCSSAIPRPRKEFPLFATGNYLVFRQTRCCFRSARRAQNSNKSASPRIDADSATWARWRLYADRDAGGGRDRWDCVGVFDSCAIAEQRTRFGRRLKKFSRATRERANDGPCQAHENPSVDRGKQ